MGKVTKYVMYVLFSILMAGVSYSIGNLIAGCVAVLFKINDAKITLYIVLAIAVAMFLIGMYLLWSGKINTKTKSGIRCLKMVVIIALGTSIVGSVLYMVLLKEIKQTMLLITVLDWVLLFGFVYTLTKIEKDLKKSE